MPSLYELPQPGDAPRRLAAVVEIPAGQRNKVEYDAALGVFRLDRVLSTAMAYPGDYGFLPRTLAGDGDPVDALVLATAPTFPGCCLGARPVALLEMEDKGEDFKVLCVPEHDPRFDGVRDLGDVREHRLAEIAHFFAAYKALEEGAAPRILGWKDAAAAAAYVRACMEAYSARPASAVR